MAASLLDWYSANARDLPWRRTRDPYAVWVSEIMLQQTQVKTVVPFWRRWMRELPTIQALARAKPAKVLKLWEGLGYYARARNLHRAAHFIAAGRKTHPPTNGNHNGACKFPETFDEILALPGVGRYTAGAICSIAFNQPAPILDGNVIRLLTRVFGIRSNPREKETNARLWSLAEALVSTQRGLQPSLLNQSLMEVGAVVCTPRRPRCEACPLGNLCWARRHERVADVPNLGRRAQPTARRFVAFVAKQRGRWLVQQRPDHVVNARLWEFPNVEVGNSRFNPQETAREVFGVRAVKCEALAIVRHSITRYRIRLDAYRVTFKDIRRPRPAGRENRLSSPALWLTPARLEKLPFASAHRKILQIASRQR